jgi:hypothetical protein
MNKEKAPIATEPQLEELLTPNSLNEVAENLNQIFFRRIGDDLIREVPAGKGILPNWKRAIELTDIILETPKRTLEQKRKHPWEYRIPVTAEGETLELNARMVGQVIRSLVGLAEAKRFSPRQHSSENKEKILADAREAAAWHFQVAARKARRAQTLLSTGKSLKTEAEVYGITVFPGIDAASPEEISHIFKAIKEKAASITNEQRQRNNHLIETRVLRQRQPKSTREEDEARVAALYETGKRHLPKDSRQIPPTQ